MKIISRETDHLRKTIVYEVHGSRMIHSFPNTDSFEDHEKRLLKKYVRNADQDPVVETKKKRPK